MFGLTPRRVRPEERGEGLVPRKPLPLNRIRDQIELMLRDWLEEPLPVLGELWEEERLWGLNVEETEKEVIVRAELPGFEPKELELHLQGNVLSIKAEHREEEPGEGKEKVCKRYDHFQRVVTLPVTPETEKLTATYRNGVLEVRAPKTEEATGKRIEITG